MEKRPSNPIKKMIFKLIGFMICVLMLNFAESHLPDSVWADVINLILLVAGVYFAVQLLAMIKKTD